MTVMVTGGLGFIGRYVVRTLSAAGSKVVSYNRDFATSDDPDVLCVQGELFDIPALVHTLRAHDVDRIIHTAGMSHPEISVSLPVTTFAANVDGTVKLWEAARLAGGVRRVVNFSSECAYGDQDESRPVRESAATRPNTPYGVTKVTTELLGDVYRRLYGLDVISLRVTEVYGPGLKMPEILRDMVVAAVHGKPFTLPEGADHRFQFVHAQDVARAAVLAADAVDPGQYVYNISGDRQVTVAELARLVGELLPGARTSVGPGHLTGWDRQGPFDLSAARKDLGYVPEWTLERGLKAYTEWLREHPC